MLLAHRLIPSGEELCAEFHANLLATQLLCGGDGGTDLKCGLPSSWSNGKYVSLSSDAH